MSTTFEWFGGVEVPARLSVTQVYAWAFDECGRVLVIEDAGQANLPGGTPEPYDNGLEATVHREVFEEADAIISDLVVLGYQEVCEDGRPPFAQLRVAARLVELRSPTADPDTGRLYERLLLPVDEAVDRLGWGAPGVAQAAAACEVARRVYGIPVEGLVSAHGARSLTARVTQVV